MTVYIEAPYSNDNMNLEKEPITSVLLLASNNMLIGGTKGGNFIFWFIDFDNGEVKLAGSYKAHEGVC